MQIFSFSRTIAKGKSSLRISSFKKILIGRPNPGGEVHGGLPSEREEARTIHQLARGAIRLGAIPNNFARETDHTLDQFRQRFYADLAAAAHIDELFFAIVIQ